MELLQLRYFIELAESEHLTNTAKKLRISAPSLSLTISKLENELGTPLFDRIGRNLRLNEYGQIYYKYVKKGLSTLDKGSKEITELMKFASATISLAIASSKIWEESLNTFKNNYPYIAVNVSTVFPDKIMTHKEWNYDFFIGITREIDNDFFEYIPLIEEEMPVILISKKNPLSKCSSIDFSELTNESFISLGELNPTSHKYILDMCRLAQFKPKNIIIADYFSRMKYLQENKGVVLTTELGMAKNSLFSEAFSSVQVSAPRLTRQQAIAWEKDSDISTAGTIFLKFMIQYCKEHPNL